MCLDLVSLFTDQKNLDGAAFVRGQELPLDQAADAYHAAENSPSTERMTLLARWAATHQFGAMPPSDRHETPRRPPGTTDLARRVTSRDRCSVAGEADTLVGRCA